MRIRPLATAAATVAALALLSSGCATTNPGWQGTDATPFDTAQAECRAEAAASPESGRDGRFNACMARHGWTQDGTRA